jgi:putative oxidoreductase
MTTMRTFQDIRRWGAEHHPSWFIIFRIALGICLFAKGISFMSNAAMLDQWLIAKPYLSKSSGWLPILITWMNLLGGFFLIVGLQTRLVAILELPILIGAIIFVNSQNSGLAQQSDLALPILVLLGLIFFVIEGGGPLSLDNYFDKNRGSQSSGRSLP